MNLWNLCFVLFCAVYFVQIVIHEHMYKAVEQDKKACGIQLYKSHKTNNTTGIVLVGDVARLMHVSA